MQRLIYNDLIKWKNNPNKKPLIVEGVRQCGKTYVIEEFCQKEYKNYLLINLLKNREIIDLYDSKISSNEKYTRLKLILGCDIEQDGTILFIDEIQECVSLIAELKYFCENHRNVNIICAGSLLGVKLRRSVLSFPVGKVEFLDMYPMNFEEFLMAKDSNMLIEEIKKHYENNEPFLSPLHDNILKLYQEFLFTGGMPEAVANFILTNNDYIKYNQDIIANIINSYFKDMKKYVLSEAETLKINKIYYSLPSQLGNNSKKFQYSKVDKNAKSRDYELPLDWLLASNLVIKSFAVSNPEIPLKGFEIYDTFKLYLSDVGILSNLLKIELKDILNDNIGLYKGIIAENYVANELIINNHDLHYWKSDNDAKIDFLIYMKDGIIPVEVKGGDATKSKSLNVYMEKYNPRYAIRISTKDFGYDKTKNIKSVPLYATFCIKKDFNQET